MIETIVKPSIGRRVAALKEADIRPRLVVLAAGDDQRSREYYVAIQKRGADLGIDISPIHFGPTVTTSEIAEYVRLHNRSKTTHGIIVEVPLPARIDTDAVLGIITPSKDVDALITEGLYVKPTTAAVRELLRYYQVDLTELRIVVLGTGRVGGPLLRLLTNEGCDVRGVNANTPPDRFWETVGSAELLITAAGQPQLVKPEHVNPGVLVVDLAGDVAPEVEAVAGGITTRKGSVGFATTHYLFANVLTSAERQHSR